MRGSTYRECWCRDKTTGKKLHGRCPDLKKKGHGQWYYRYEAPRAPGERRRQPVGGPYGTKAEAQAELAAVLARIGGGGAAPDRSVRITDWLDSYLAGKVNLKARSLATDREAFELYWKPALGHLRVADVRPRHVAEVIREMMRVNQPGDGPSEMLRRMIGARADDERRELPPGEQRRKKSAKPLSPARIARIFAPFRAAMRTAARQQMIAMSPCDGVELPRAARPDLLAWTRAREEAFWAALDKHARAADVSLTGRQGRRGGSQALWSAPGLRPSPVMVWMPAHAGRFLEQAAGERLFALFCVAVFCGLRRDELIGLPWSDVDLEEQEPVVMVRRTGGGDGPKSERGTRHVPLPPPAVRALRAWRKRQAADRLAWGHAWTDNGLVFTRPDGSPVPGQWVSARFETLAWRAGLPPVRFHDLRHGVGSRMKAAGSDTKPISAVLGHSRTSFTDATYVAVYPDVAAEAMARAAALIPGADADSR